MSKTLISTLFFGKLIVSIILWFVAIYKIWNFYQTPAEKRAECSVSGWITVLCLTTVTVVLLTSVIAGGVRLVHHRHHHHHARN